MCWPFRRTRRFRWHCQRASRSQQKHFFHVLLWVDALCCLSRWLILRVDRKYLSCTQLKWVKPIGLICNNIRQLAGGRNRNIRFLTMWVPAIEAGKFINSTQMGITDNTHTQRLNTRPNIARMHECTCAVNESNSIRMSIEWNDSQLSIGYCIPLLSWL